MNTLQITIDCTSDCRRNGCDHAVEKELSEAKAYINFGIQEGAFSPEDFEDMDEQEIIDFAKENGERGDYYANK